MAEREPVLRLDYRGRRVAAAVIAKPIREQIAVNNDAFVELFPSNVPNVVVDRTGGPRNGF